MLACYLRPGNVEISLQNVYDFVPNFETEVHGRGVSAYTPQDGRPRIAMDHSSFQPASHGGQRVVLLLRDPRDVLVSHWHHATYHYSENVGTLEDFIHDHRYGLAHYLDYLDFWAEPVSSDADNVMLLTYEAMQRDGQRALSECLTQFGIPVNWQRVEEAVRMSEFDQMKRLEIVQGIKGISYNRTDIRARRVRRGKVGGYTEYLQDSDIRWIEAQLRKRMKFMPKVIAQLSRAEWGLE